MQVSTVKIKNNVVNSTVYIGLEMRVVCYYANWSLYREAMPILYPDQIDPTLCTHIHYAFADIDPLTLNIIPTELHDVQWTDRHSMASVLLYLYYNFKDWEFPGDRDRDAAPDSQIKFDILVKDLYQAFNDEVKKPNNTRQRLILTAAVAADPKKIDHGYIVQNLCGHLDYVNIMTYDYHGKWDDVTGINSPLYRSHTHLKHHEEWKNAVNIYNMY
ncbi:unnamed protein product [Didymodactylos carnosus]|uniref:GH18 domain-containing protein n=1 Tax=Didymodactylos carnosus TaxID=1234261 RepID=A0A816DB37_9BILA|nr:unnamed protein product [Didymodactylos carnosus]CAF4536340.1 unnamed protein product [Didymodactylos carnosus]